MCSAQHNFSNGFHPKLARLEELFQDILTRQFDAETLIKLMRMEAETMFPGLTEQDQGQIVDIVLEHMQIDAPQPAMHLQSHVSNVIPFPAGGRVHRQ